MLKRAAESNPPLHKARVMPFWESTIAPELKKGKTVFVAAHGNSIRAILKFLEGISDDDITGREKGTSAPREK